MATLEDVANGALSYLGIRAKIVAIDEDSVEAKACRTHVSTLRDTALRLHDWNFARVTAVLTPLPDPDPPSRWRQGFALPAECICLRRARSAESGQALAFELALDVTGGATVWCDRAASATGVEAIYTARIEDPTRWDAGFADAMAHGLAARVCFELTGRDDRARTLAQSWNAMLLQAMAAAANEGGGR